MKKKKTSHIIPIDKENNKLMHCRDGITTSETNIASKDARKMIESLKHLEA